MLRTYRNGTGTSIIVTYKNRAIHRNIDDTADYLTIYNNTIKQIRATTEPSDSCYTEITGTLGDEDHTDTIHNHTPPHLRQPNNYQK